MVGILLNIVFSVLLIPVNLICSYPLFKEVMSLSGVTFKKMYADIGNTLPTTHTRRFNKNKAKIRSKKILQYLLKTSPEPERTKALFKFYLYSTYPSAAALLIAFITASLKEPDHLKFAFIGNLFLLAVNIAMVYAAKKYSEKHPLDEAATEKLRKLREREKKDSITVKSIIAYIVTGVFFLAIQTVFMFAVASIVQNHYKVANSPSQEISSFEINHIVVNTAVSKRGFETANIPTTFWQYDEDKLRNVISGIKDGSAFEYYEYSDGDSVEFVFNQISYSISENIEPSEHEKYISELDGGGKIFVLRENGVLSIVLYKENTAVYAYSPEDSDEIEDILSELGYIGKDAFSALK